MAAASDLVTQNAIWHHLHIWNSPNICHQTGRPSKEGLGVCLDLLDSMSESTECVALELEVSFTGLGHIAIIFITLIFLSSSLAAALLSADKSFTLQSL